MKQEKSKDFLKAVLFTNKKLDGKLFAVTKDLKVDMFGKPFHTISLYDVKENELENYLDENNKPIDFDKIKLEYNPDEFTTFSKDVVYISRDFAHKNRIGYSNLSKHENSNKLSLNYLYIGRKYREMGLASSVVEIVKAYGKAGRFARICGIVMPQDAIKKSKVLKPAIVKDRKFYQNKFKFQQNNPDLINAQGSFEMKGSTDALKQIYLNMGFDIKKPKVVPGFNNDTDELDFDLSKYKKDKNYSLLVESLDLKKSIVSDFIETRKGIKDKICSFVTYKVYNTCSNLDLEGLKSDDYDIKSVTKFDCTKEDLESNEIV